MMQTTQATNRSKDEVTEELAQAHFDLDEGLDRILVLESADAREADLIKLLEVNRDTAAAGVRPVYFGAHPASGMTYPSVVVEIAPHEVEESLAELQRRGWTVNREIRRRRLMRR